jgi:alpha-glucosidase
MRRLGLLVAAILLAPAAAHARPVETYVAEQNGVRVEISAPRPDIVRIRVGRPDLPENSSWAVLEAARTQHAPMEATEAADGVTLTTSALTVSISKPGLAVTIRDRSGHVVLADAPGEAMAFANGGFRLRKAMPRDAHYFGLGDKAGSLDRRGGAYALWNTDSFGFGEASDPLYKSVPFVLGLDEGGRSFGLFLDDTWRSTFDFGKTERDVFAFGAEGGPVDYYVMVGATPKDVVQDYAWLTGAPPLTPLWALGFQQSHWSYMTQDEAQRIADRLRRDQIPADVLWLDIDYQDRDRPFTVNTKTFPDLPGLVKSLAREDMHLVVITDLHVADAPGQGYAPYDSGMAAGVFLKKPDGQPYVGEVWPGPAVFPDFSRKPVREWWGTQFRDFTAMGVAGFWNDMNEPAIFNVPSKTMPLDVVHRIEEPGFAPRAASHAEMHNVYGMLNSRATYEGTLGLVPDRRPFVMTRASFAGGQRWAATWTGDNSSSWTHLNLSTEQLVSLGLSGFAYAGDDIGGFAGDPPSPELLTRWIEVGAFNPIFRDHYQKDKPAQEVWVHGAEQEAIRRRYIEARYRLMPYIYALAEENSRTGVPLMRPVFLEYPKVVAGGDRLGGTESQFMLGPDLLIAPPPTPESPAAYTAPLPGPGWYDYWTGRRIDDSKTLETPALDHLPVYVRPGAILPRQPLVQATGQTPKGDLELAVYPGEGCRGQIYLDDGVSFAYRRGDYLRQSVRCDGHSLSFGAREGRYKPWWDGITVVIHGWTGGAAQVRLAGKPIAAQVDAQAGTLTFRLPDLAAAATVTIGGGEGTKAGK